MRKYMLAVGVAAAAVVVLLLYFTGGGGLERVTSERVAEGDGSPAGSLKTSYLLALEVEGGGKLLVNGSQVESLALNRTFTAVVEAVPEPCYALKQLLVNGTPVEGSSVELRIGGNTTVKVVFERPLHTLLVHANVPEAPTLINGSLYSLPAVLGVKRCDVVNVTPVAPRGYRPLNGSLLYRVEEDAKLLLLFKKVVKLEFVNVKVPVEVLYSGGSERVEGFKVIEVDQGEVIHVKLVDVDKQGCKPFNGTHNICHVGWWNGTAKLYARYLILNASSDATFEQLTFYALNRLPPIRLEIPTPRGMVEVMAYPPYLDLIIPITGSYRYLEDGWIEFRGGENNLWALHIEVPPWRKLKVTCLLSEAARRITYIEVIVRTEPTFLMVGRVPLQEEVVYIIDWELVEKYREAGDISDVPLDEFVKLFQCVKGCNPRQKEMTGVGPTTRRFQTPAEVGWLVISGYGYARIRIEVVESPP